MRAASARICLCVQPLLPVHMLYACICLHLSQQHYDPSSFAGSTNLLIQKNFCHLHTHQPHLSTAHKPTRIHDVNAWSLQHPRTATATAASGPERLDITSRQPWSRPLVAHDTCSTATTAAVSCGCSRPCVICGLPSACSNAIGYG